MKRSTAPSSPASTAAVSKKIKVTESERKPIPNPVLIPISSNSVNLL
jgi:hypothetical protein